MHIISRKTAAIVPVAGLSSRMGNFKPLMELNGFPMIRMTVQSLLDGGVDIVCIVLGCEAESVEASLLGITELSGSGTSKLSPPRIIYIKNNDFENTDMLASVQLGLNALFKLSSNINSYLIVPGDTPAISPKTISSMLSAFKDGAIRASYKGKGAHPLLLSPDCAKEVCVYTGSGGIKSILANKRHSFEVNDPGVLYDADTPESFAKLSEYIKANKGISRDLVDMLLDEHGTYHHIRNHCRAVGEMSARMSKHLNILNYHLDTELCRSAAALHDMDRLHKRHSQEAARHLRIKGYMAIASAVAAHDAFFGIYPRTFTESAIICTADKLLKETELVSLEKRYEAVLKKFSPESKIGRRIRMDRDICAAIVARYEQITGDLIYI